jgi:hypothetical protein
MGAPYDIDDTIWLGAPYDIDDIVSTDYFFSTRVFFFFFQILVLIFTDVCGKYLREKNGDAHKGIQNVTIRIVIRIVTCLKYRDTYHDKNSVSLHS